MIHQIKRDFGKEVYAVGRNGSSRCKGIEIIAHSGVVGISSITSQGVPVNGGIFQIPVDDAIEMLEEAVSALKEYRRANP